MRKLIVVSSAALAAGACALAAPASAQDAPRGSASLKVEITPKRAGTTTLPRGVELHVQSDWNEEPGVAPPFLRRLELRLGKGLRYNGRKYPRCTKKVLDREGPKGCPKRSIVGSRYSATGEHTRPDVLSVNAGARRAFLYTTTYSPTLVQESIPLDVATLTGRWNLGLTVDVPEDPLRIPIFPYGFSAFAFELGGTERAKRYMAATDCPRGGWRYRLTATYDEVGTTTVRGAIRCRS